MTIFSSTFSTLEQALNFTTAKNRTISNNIANVDTPGYKEGVAFQDVLNGELASIQTKRTDERHIDFRARTSNSFHTFTKTGTTYSHNGNNVDVDKEMNDLAQNQIQYEALVDRMSGKFKSLESVIKGGR